MVGAGEEIRRDRKLTAVTDSELFENLRIVLAKRGRRRIDARAAMRKRKCRERHAERAINAVTSLRGGE